MVEYNKKGNVPTNKKNLDKVQYSIKDKYGFIPKSILDLIPNEELVDYFGKINENDNLSAEEIRTAFEEVLFETFNKLEEKYGRLPKSIENFTIPREYRDFIDDTSVVKRVTENGGVAKSRGGGFASTYNYSTFNPALAEFLLKLYFKEGDIICDPFAGRSTRALMANKNKIHYHGWDVSEMTIKINENKISELQDELHPFYDPNYDIKYFCEDGTKMESAKEKHFYDGCITCPPYFNIEKYESGDNQLSDYKNYDKFLEHYKNTFTTLANVIKPTTSIDDFHPLVIVTGNFRLNKALKDFTGDTRRLAEQAGFILYDEIHQENNSPFVFLASRRNEARKMVSKVHETVSVFIKLGDGIKSI